MTGEAAQQAMQSAVDIAKAVSDMTGSLAQQGLQQIGSAPTNLTEKGGTLNELRKQLGKGPELDHKVEETLGLEPPTPPTQPPATSGGAPSPDAPAPIELPSPVEEITQPGQIHTIEPDEGAWQDAIEPWQEQFADLTSGPGGVPVQPTTEELVAHGMGMFNELVLPDLQQAVSDDRLLSQSLFQWLEWKAHTQQIGIASETEIVGAEEQATIWAVGGLRNAVQMAADRAVASNDWRYLLDALDWSAQAELFTLAEPENRLHHDDVLADFPLRVEILEAHFPETLGPDQTAMLSVKAGLRIQDNPPILNEPLAWEVTADGGTISGPGSGLTNDLGGFAVTITRSGQATLHLTAKVSFVLDGMSLYEAQWSQEVGLPG
jgi:hypothetical protein